MIRALFKVRRTQFWSLASALVFAIILTGNNGFAHDPKKNPVATKIFSNLSQPTQTRASAIGSYAKGCLAGAEQLPFNGPNWQVLHPQRKRNWGHPETVALVKRVSKAAADIGWTGLFIGDISQSRGGPMPYGHRSHQIGLDVDIWLTQPRKLGLTNEELKAIKPISVRAKNGKKTNANWTTEHMDILKVVASDEAVDRVFITAPAKIAMCQNAEGDRSWLQKIRPLGGHHQHFHVRLHCPKHSTDCIPQTPSITKISQSADGCDHTLEWWVTTALAPYKKPAKPAKKRPAKRSTLDFTMKDLPKQCLSVIHAD